MDFLHYAAFGVYPYICLGTFLLGSLLRFNKDQKGWKSDSSQLIAPGWLAWGSNLFHIGILFLLAGHGVGFLIPLPVFHFFGIDLPAKQLLSMVLGGVAGTLAFFGLVILIGRRLFNERVRKTSRISDVVLLFWLLIVLSLGMTSILTSVKHTDGLLMKDFIEYVQGILTWQPDPVSHILEAPWIYKAHMFMAFTLFLIFPFTRLVHIWSGFGSVGSYLLRKLQLVRRRR